MFDTSLAADIIPAGPLWVNRANSNGEKVMQNNKRNNFSGYAQKRADTELRLLYQSGSGVNTMVIKRHLTRRDIPELQRVVVELEADTEPSRDDTADEHLLQRDILAQFFELIRATRVMYHNRETNLEYAIRGLLGWSALVNLGDYYFTHKQRIKHERLKRISADPRIVNRIALDAEEIGKEVARELLKKFITADENNSSFGLRVLNPKKEAAE